MALDSYDNASDVSFSNDECKVTIEVLRPYHIWREGGFDDFVYG